MWKDKREERKREGRVMIREKKKQWGHGKGGAEGREGRGRKKRRIG